MVDPNVTKTSAALLRELDALAADKRSRSGDEVLIDMMAKFASLLVVLSAGLDRAQRTIARLTWAIVAMTIVLLALTTAQAYFSYKALTTAQTPNPPSTTVHEAPAK